MYLNILCFITEGLRWSHTLTIWIMKKEEEEEFVGVWNQREQPLQDSHKKL